MTKRINISIVFFVTILFFVSTLGNYIVMSEDISNKVLRLHIVANSDSVNDQALKLKVRDAILSATGDGFKGCKNLNSAITVAKDNIGLINAVARQTVELEGYDYAVSSTVTSEFFDTRIYDDFTMPSGEYNTIRVILGNGRGHNWWCVMYPQVCLSGCTDDLGRELSASEIGFVTSDNYIVRFKCVELYEKIKYKLLLDNKVKIN